MAESNKRFVITITERTFEPRWLGREWKQGAAEDGVGYGYTPTIEQMVEIEREVFKQDADSLDLIAVIKAVNGI